jgi:hypothetical protein
VINNLKPSRNKEVFNEVLKYSEHLLPETITESPKCKKKTHIMCINYTLSESHRTNTYVKNDINITLLRTLLLLFIILYF